jgi:hypothetical protein
MGNLFYRGQATSDIKKMNLAELKYWNGWHEVLKEETARQNKEMDNLLKGIK